MQNLTLILALMLTLGSGCSNSSQEHEAEHDRNSKSEYFTNNLLLDFETLRKKFKFGHLDSFTMDSIEWHERVNHYQKMSGEEFYSVYQDTSMEYMGEYQYNIDLDFLYSIQDRHSNFRELTVLWQREGSYCDGIQYLIFDRTGKLISSFPLVGACSDGGFYESSYGKFLNDTTYRLTIEDNYESERFKTEIITITEQVYTITKQGDVTKTQREVLKDTIR